MRDRQMMTKLLSEIRQCEMNEYDRAVKDHGFSYHSLHESYAVIREETDEAYTEMTDLGNIMGQLWAVVKQDDMATSERLVKLVEDKAQLLAAEAVQVATTARKTLNTIQQYRWQNQNGNNQGVRLRRAGRYHTSQNNSPEKPA